MWQKLARFVLRWRWMLLVTVAGVTAFFAYHASKVELSYEFSKAIPTDNPKYKIYQAFRQKFGEDGNLLVIGVQTDKFFELSFFNSYARLVKRLKKIDGVEDVISAPGVANLVKDTVTEKLNAVPIFPDSIISQRVLDSSKAVLLRLPFYRGILYNPSSNAYLIGVRINRDVLNSKQRNAVVAAITAAANTFSQEQNTEVHFSGLPFIRTNMATRIANEMRWFLLGSLLLSALILLFFFRSVGAMALSLSVVVIGVVWSFGTMHLLGYKITLLNALIPPLIVVIGIPNCIYFLNKYHTSFNETGQKDAALVEMISRMGIVTLFCNIAAAIGFTVFAFTRSAILYEFGTVAGINILALFFISLVVIPSVLSLLPPPRARETKYLQNRWLLSVLKRLEIWALNHQRTIYIVTLLAIGVAITGITRLRSEAFIVDDLPTDDRIYTDLKFFERNFKGVMPLEILVDTRRKNGIRANLLPTFQRIDSLSQFIALQPGMGRPISVVEGMKFARQAYYDGDSASYAVPNSFDLAFLSQYLSGKDTGQRENNISRVIRSFMDSDRQQARISVNMADVGSKRLPMLLDSIAMRGNQLFDSTKYTLQYTGTTVTFLEGSTFIIRGLKESILWAFALIALCMLYLFRSFRILICSLIPNVIPLVITAGVMGWASVAIKPSTVLVFSVALGIAIDITIRFLVNYKQELNDTAKSPREAVIETIHKTGISIIYTSLVLIAGFVIFCFSGFGGTKALGWLTSLTLVMATLTNLIFLPALLISLQRKK